MHPIEWLEQPICRLLTLTLLHFVWQGLAIVLALVLVADVGNVRRAAARYACSLGALIAMTACPLVTLAWLALFSDSHLAAITTLSHLDLAHTAAHATSRGEWLDIAQPYCFAAWLAGVTISGCRLLSGAAGLVRLRRGRLPLPLKLAYVVDDLGQRMKMKALPVVFLSKQVVEAMAIGLVRPLVLIPAAWATEMPLEMLEAVIAHELAHLKRCDLWINLFQRIVETLLFYHPAVWWLSQRLRVERELCADELAVAATGRRLVYAKALEQIACERQADIRPALAAFLRGETKMRLLQRVRHVLGQPPSESSRLWPVGLLALALPLGLWAASMLGGSAIADDERDEPKKPTIKRERDDDGDNEKKAIVILRKRGEEAEEAKKPTIKRERDDDGEGEKKPLVILRKRNEEGEEAKKPEKRATIEERVERYTFRKDGQRPEEIERKVITKDGKPVVELVLDRGQERSGGDRRLDELTALVKRLAERVEKLQSEVTELRGEKAAGKPPVKFKQDLGDVIESRKREMKPEFEKIEQARRALSEKEGALKDRIKLEVAEKMKAAEEQARAAREKAEAAREKTEAGRDKVEAAAREKLEAARKAIDQKLRELKDREINPEEKEAILRKLRERQSLLRDPEKPLKPKPPTKDDDDSI
jgi:beta-lactamase regulating signal transducer with metallopeptidase domain